MMDLAELRINRTPVTPNSKCESCVHYDGNAAAKGGACEVGTSPALCGNGTERKYGFAPLDELGPDEIDDLATPSLVGASGAMNEHGEIEQMIKMKRVVLGDEDLSIAQRIHGELQGIAKKSIGYAQGEVNAFAGAELAQQRYGQPKHMLYTVAKSLRDLHFAPRKQRKYDVVAVLDFMFDRGLPVTDDDYIAAGICKSDVQLSPSAPTIGASRRKQRASTGGATVKMPPVSNAEAAANLKAGKFIEKAVPNVRKLDGADPFDKRR